MDYINYMEVDDTETAYEDMIKARSYAQILGGHLNHISPELQRSP